MGLKRNTGGRYNAPSFLQYESITSVETTVDKSTWASGDAKIMTLETKCDIIRKMPFGK
jgi:hypothetical protein